MAEARIKISGEDAASAVLAKVDQSVGQLTADAFQAAKAVADLKQELQEAVNKGQQGSIAAISAQLDDAIPKLQDAERELKAKLKPAVDDASESTSNWNAQLGTLKQGLGALGIGLSVGAVVGFGKAILDDADALAKMHDRTNISIEGLQRLQLVGDDAGNSIQEITGAINTFQDRIASGNETTLSALRELGLEIDDITRMPADQQFMAISDAIRTVDNPAKQVALSVDLLGATGKQVLPTLKQGFDDVRDAAVGMSTETAERLANLGDDLDATVRRTKGYAAEALVAVIDYVASAGNATIAKAQADVRETQALITELKDMAKDAKGPALFAGPAEQFVAAESDIKAAIQESEEAARKAEAAHKKAAAEAERHAEALKKFEQNTRDVLLASQGFEVVLDTLDGSVVAAVEDYRDAGVSMNRLATMYELTEVQVSALTEAERAEQEMLDNLTRGNEALARALDTRNRRQRESYEVLDGAPAARGVDGITLSSGANPQLEAIRNRFSVGLSEVLQNELPASIMRAIEGGGSIIGAAGSTMGSFLVSEKGFGKQLSSGLTGLFGEGLGTAINTMLPGLGSLMGPLLQKIGSLLQDAFGGPSQQELEGRDAEAAFEGRFRNFDDMVNRVGDAYAATGRSREEAQAAVQEMLDAERFGAEAVADAIERLNGVMDEANRARDGARQFGPSQSERNAAAEDARATLDYMLRLQQQGEYTQEQVNQAYYNWQKKMAEAGNAAAQAWVDAQDAATKGTSAASRAMSELQRQRDELAGTYANEAAEAEMGSAERDARARVAAIEAQMQAQQEAVQANTEQATDAAATIEDEFRNCWGRVGEDGQATADEIADYFANLDLVVPVRFDYERPEFNAGQPPPSYANEGFDLTRPHLARIGDAPGDSESVLRAQTVRDIVRASRNAGVAQAAPTDFTRLAAAIGDRLAGAAGAVTLSIGRLEIVAPENASPRKLAAAFLEALRTQSELYDGIRAVRATARA